MFHQLLTPVGGSLGLSFLVALLPIVTVLVLLGILKRPAWQAAFAGLVVAFLIAVSIWAMPVQMALAAACNGAVFALWPVMWIVINALFLYNIAVASGRFDAFRDWVITHLPNDRRVILVVIGFCFGALLEGIAGFGAPVAITASLLILVGFAELDALVFVLIFNTTPVAFGALGTPVDGSGRGDRAACGRAGGHDRPSIAVDGDDSAVLRHGVVRRVALGADALAGIARRRRQLRRGAVRRVQLSGLHPHGRAGGAGVAHRHGALPAGVAAGRGGRVLHRALAARHAEVSSRARGRMAGMDSLADRVCHRDPVDNLQNCRHGPNQNSLARSQQGDCHHALPRQTIRSGVGISAARDRDGDIARGIHHCGIGALAGSGTGAVRGTPPFGRSGWRS